jgi:hypothetical protein
MSNYNKGFEEKKNRVRVIDEVEENTLFLWKEGKAFFLEVFKLTYT